MGSQFTPEAIRAELVKRYPSAFDGSDPVEESNIQLRNARDWVLAYYLSKATRTPASGPVEADDRLAVGRDDLIQIIEPEADYYIENAAWAEDRASWRRRKADAGTKADAILALLTSGEAEG